MKYVWIFAYTDCFHECSPNVVSVHCSQTGAKLAMAIHKQQKKKEWDKLWEGDTPTGEFTDMQSWVVYKKKIQY